MTWLDLYNYLHERANDVKNPGSFPWQEDVKVWDWETLDYYPAEFIKNPSDKNISLSVDTSTIGILSTHPYGDYK